MRWMMLLAFVVATVVGAESFARGGVVVGQDGKTYVGKVELKANDRIAVTPAGGQTVTIPLADVARVSMGDEGENAPAAAGGENPAVPAPWRHQDIGRVKAAGDAAANAETFDLRAAGWGFWGPSDSGHLVYRPLAGDGEIVARVVDAPTRENAFQAGIVIRSGLKADAAQVAVMVQPGGVPRLSYRPVDGHGAGVAAGVMKPSTWVRLIRAQNVFEAFYSADGRTWTPLGVAKVNMDEPVYACLACAATANQEVAEAAFDHVSVRSEFMGPGEGLGLVDGTLLAGHVNRLDAKKGVSYVDPAGTERTMALEKVAYVFTRPLLPEMRGKAIAGRPRVCLANGDVMEVEVKGIDDRRVSAVSLMFGMQHLELARVYMVILRPATPAGEFSVYARDGSVYRCGAVKVSEGGVSGDSAALGTVEVKAGEVVGIVQG